MEIQKTREDFKKLAAKIGFDLYEEDGVFFYEEVKMAFELFLAVNAQAIPEGFVLVPKLLANSLLNYVASEFKESAKEFVKEDHEKQIKFIKKEWSGGVFDSCCNSPFRCNNKE